MKEIILLTVVLAVLVPIICTAAEPVRFQWDYDSETIAKVATFKLYQRVDDSPYDYSAPAWESPPDDGYTEAGTVRTYDHTMTIEIPANSEGVLHFVMRAADAAGNESGDSNEVSLPYDTAAPPAVIRFQLIIDTSQ